MSEYSVFISFADENEAYAVKLCEALDKEGIKAWCSAKNVGVAGNIYGEVCDAIHHAPFFLPLISKHYQRNWHKIEFENGCYGKDFKYIIPVAYGVDYKYIESNPMFALIRNIRLVMAHQTSVTELAKLIAARIRNPEASPIPSKNLLMSLLPPFILDSKFLVSFVAAILALFLYKLFVPPSTPSESHSRSALPPPVITDTLLKDDSFKEVSELPQIEIDFDNPNIDKLKVVNIKQEKTEHYLSDGYKGLLVLNFILHNKGNQDFDLAYIKVEALRNADDLYFKNKTSALRKISNASSKSNVLAIEIPYEYPNTHYLCAVEPSIDCPKGEQIVLPVVFYQKEQNNYLLPDTDTEFIVYFITKQRTYALSKRFYFGESALYSDYQ